MRSQLAIALVSLLALPLSSAFAEDRRPFYGSWGDEKQCARQPIIEGGTFLAKPFEINSEWLKHGQLYCSLTWNPVGKRDNGTSFTSAWARCGEDSVRGYSMRFILNEKDEMTISWDLTTVKGPLMQCPSS